MDVICLDVVAQLCASFSSEDLLVELGQQMRTSNVGRKENIKVGRMDPLCNIRSNYSCLFET